MVNTLSVSVYLDSHGACRQFHLPWHYGSTSPVGQLKKGGQRSHGQTLQHIFRQTIHGTSTLSTLYLFSHSSTGNGSSVRAFCKCINLDTIYPNDSCGLYKQFVLLPYGEDWRKQRRLMAQEFSQNGVTKYFPLQEKQMRILVRNVLNDPTNLTSQINL